MQNLREIVQKMKTETEHLKTLLVEREIEIGACKKEIEMQDMERTNLENKNLEVRKLKSVKKCLLGPLRLSFQFCYFAVTSKD